MRERLFRDSATAEGPGFRSHTKRTLYNPDDNSQRTWRYSRGIRRRCKYPRALGSLRVLNIRSPGSRQIARMNQNN